MLTFFVFARFFFFCFIFYKCVLYTFVMVQRRSTHHVKHVIRTHMTLTMDYRVFATWPPSPPRLVFVVSLYVIAHNELVIASCHCCGIVKCYCTHHVNNTCGKILCKPWVSRVASVLVIRLRAMINGQVWVYIGCTCVYTELLAEQVYKSSNGSTGSSVQIVTTMSGIVRTSLECKTSFVGTQLWFSYLGSTLLGNVLIKSFTNHMS